MMKLYNKLSIGAVLVVLGFTSCAKDNTPVPEAELTVNTEFSGIKMIAGVNYKLAEEWGEDPSKKSEARAVVSKTEYDIPYLSITDTQLKVRWAVYRKSGSSVADVKFGDITNKHSNYNLHTNMGTGFTVLDEGNRPTAKGKKIAVSIDGGSNKFKAGEYAYMVLGGVHITNTTDEGKVSQGFGYYDNDTPNANSRMMIAKHNSEQTIPFPLTTKVHKITPQRIVGSATNKFDGSAVNWVKMATKFDARGTVIGFKIINNTKFKLQIKQLEISNHDKKGCTFATKGYFTPVGMSYAVNDADSDLKFVSVDNTENEQVRRYDLVGENGVKGFDLNEGEATGGRFYFWGYPVNPTRPLYVAVRYQFYNYNGTAFEGDEHVSVVQKIAVPSSGRWGDGEYFRINLKLKKWHGDPDPVWEKIEFCDPNNTPSSEPNLPTDYDLEGVLNGNKY